ncbi:hypothetical protein GUITHDRAFT_63734 [Guillardia theta CCMP2712]|uniref:NOL1/NOP2/Sun domain family member 4 n=1 Tax=Guillardia theta (strain CCMP2712) TaxID=905079 RepID=L1K0A0_GUITC|nr:hypothetical protein GUITHDRAFT_63734 [Guillardia theta CCMP2712]EKX53989.1 hypothetical protein GUITHDRAFT_63734 [Guillardia theta CCMP2712]|eukprot:XP_005840969.1 hypothetical protein GUITHDRAFT_63734 [Guillardia theta CCMP2712]
MKAQTKPQKSVAAKQQNSMSELDRYFVNVYGSKRWSELREALEKPTEHVAWINPFCDFQEQTASRLLGEEKIFDASVWKLVRYSDKFSFMVQRDDVPSDIKVNMPPPAPIGLRQLHSHYVLDGASPLPAISLRAAPGSRVLDICAAPGGKSLVIAGGLFDVETSGAKSMLTSNDRSQPRRDRLLQVMREYIPAELKFQGILSVTGVDATLWGRSPATCGCFDRILVDAPCSSERHIVHGSSGSSWTHSRLKRDAKLQGQILQSAIRVLNPNGGRLVYSTCSIAPEENDEVISKIINNSRLAKGLKILDPLVELQHEALGGLLQGVERTKYGAIMLPDKSKYGPLYWCVMEKTISGAAGTAWLESESDSDSENQSGESSEGQEET